MSGTRRTAELQDRWPELRALMSARADWDPADAEAAIRAWEMAGLPFGDAFREAYRAIWDPDGDPHEIRNTARARAFSRAGTGVTAEEREELWANLVTACEAATSRQRQQAAQRETAA